MLSSVSYPSDGQVARLTEITASNDYEFEHGFIPDVDYKLKSDEEIADFKSKKSIKRDNLAIQDEQEFIDLCTYIENEIVSFQLTPDMRKRLQKLKKDDYDYPVILQSYNGPPVKTTLSNFIVNQIFPILTLAASRATPHI